MEFTVSKLERKPLDKVVPARVDSATYETLVAEAKQQKLSKTALVRLALIDYLQKPQKSEAPIAS